ncbi:phosphotransferase [Glycomyces buryatensis]|uniref:Aminoglycoside phosphotransferase family protein n=1 Tax=Glycomyces buryatensis TaxID=2570927 RepID=A0A4S8Q9Y1_9ACTN|nr:phosphotransferase [Glycomyces buryatensis]THV41273.1 aminoglycoside phosphotransferase family protein [Glycomyces buryatensis]
MSSRRETHASQSGAANDAADLTGDHATAADAVPLTGGRMAAGITRVGDTVRRPVSASSDFMAALLRLLERQHFGGAPRYLGRVDGADVLSFIPGDIPAKFQSWSDEQVQSAASLLRSMHDATRGSALAGRLDVVCHHDPGPNNVVFQNDAPTAFIDFAEAAPGSRLEDVGYLAWTWSISSKQSLPLPRQAEQTRLIADAYGLETAERLALIDCVLERQARNVRFWAEFQTKPHTAPAAPDQIAERIAWSRRELAFVSMHRDVFDQALGDDPPSGPASNARPAPWAGCADA